MAITTMHDLVAAMAATSQTSRMMKTANWGTKGAGYYHSLWRVDGQPLSGAIPLTGGGETCSRATTGAMPLVNAGAGKQLYLARASLSTVTAARFMFYDRLVQTSGLATNSSALQTVNTVALPRHTNGVGVEIWLELYAASPSTAMACTVTYTNQGGVSGRVSLPSWIVSAPAGTLIPCPLQAGDTGALSVQSIQFDVVGAASGNFGVTLLKQIVDFPLPNTGPMAVMDAITLGLPPVANDACLAIMGQCTASNQLASGGALTLIEG